MSDKNFGFKMVVQGMELQAKLIKVIDGYNTVAIVGAIGSLFCEIVSKLEPHEKQFLLKGMHKSILEAIKYQDEHR